MAPNCQCQCHSTGGRRIRAWWCRAELTSGAGPPAGQLVPGAVQSKAHQRSWAAPNKTGAQAQRQLRHRQTQTRTTQPGQVQRLRAASNKTVHLKDGRHYPQPPSPDSNRRAEAATSPAPGKQERARAHQRSWACRRNSSNKHSQQDTHTREEKSTQNTTKQQQKDKTRHGSSVVAG